MGPCRDKVKNLLKIEANLRTNWTYQIVDLEMNAGICSTDLVLYTLVSKQMNESCSDEDSMQKVVASDGKAITWKESQFRRRNEQVKEQETLEIEGNPEHELE